jgi:hypothetical protein
VRAKFAHDWYHWFFFAQPDKPERAILADPEAWYRGDPERMGSRLAALVTAVVRQRPAEVPA